MVERAIDSEPPDPRDGLRVAGVPPDGSAVSGIVRGPTTRPARGRGAAVRRRSFAPRSAGWTGTPPLRVDHARRSEAFRALFDQAPVAMLALDSTGIIERANAVMARLIGLAPVRVIARHVTALAPDVSRADFVAAIRSLLDGSATDRTFESRLVDGEGATRAIRLSIAPVRDGRGRLVTFVAYIADVTAERAEHASRIAGERRLRAALDAAMDAFVLLGRVDGAGEPEFEVLDVNASGEQLLGGSRPEVVGRRLSELMDRRILDILLPTYRRVLRTGQPVDEELEFVIAGQPHVLHHQVVAAADGVAVTSRDVTGERVEERRRRREARIAEAIFEHSPIGIQLFNADGTSARMNEAQRRLLGVPSTSYGVGSFNILADQFTAITGEAAEFRRAYDGETVDEFEYDVDMGAPQNDWSTRSDAASMARTIFPLRGETGEVTGVVSFLRDVTARAELERRLEFLAYHDSLTSLANRQVLLDRLAHALASRRTACVGVALIDLDEFKLVNDRLGHAAGDRLLQHVAACLTSSVRDGDTVARLGGDEFAVVLDDVAGIPEARIVAERMLERLGAPIEVAGVETRASASIGIILAERGVAADDALRAADDAMYRAKAAGPGRVIVRPDPIGAPE